MNRLIVAVSAVAVAALALGCRDEGQVKTAAGPDGQSPVWLLTTPPEAPQSITQARAGAAEGDAVVLRGRIGGRRDPISPGSPVFTVVDLSIPYCGQDHEDDCPQPWDYCCEPREKLKAGSATVQVVGADGQAASAGPAAAGLKPLDEVIVVGTVGPRPNDDVFIVRATGIYQAARPMEGGKKATD